eukprot:CAMPEP_0201601906 /NCGR_PEP_ID=MMETSP0492-20130828/2756_1 /ASSEMBLY_ACC=CAM_ASM_000837 /TAXON_ID=420259 /ORGANISM="Thalassiosira gravida, Strain GMp14c1" /LENGTH=160 /DNA_ID=CAMNT_0048065265 /DNA_START=453 /DNA_END=935 /DNA_ORIENTATION=-
MLVVVDGLTEMCAKAKECCGTTEASNGDFDVCIADVTVPDLASFMGIPDVSSMGSPVCAESVSDDATETAATKGVIVTLPTEPSKGVVVTLPTVPVTEAPKTTAETPVTEAPADTTGTPEVDDTTPDDTLSPDDGLNGVNKYTVGTLMTLVGSALSILFV